MRASQETERTEVPSRPASRLLSDDHMSALTEKSTKMDNKPELDDLVQSESLHRQLDDHQDSTIPDTPEQETEKDLEKGDIQPEKKQEDPNLVVWDGPDDPGNPMNWPTSKKWRITVTLSLMTFCVTFASSVFSTATTAVSTEFGISTEVSILGTSLFVLGYAIGPLVWGPGSELFGRKLPLFLGFFVFAIFQIPVAVAVNVETIMLCRFFGGVFACSPLAIIGGALADFWNPVDRGVAMVGFASATFIGPVAGPIMGGFITQSYLGWRWTAWITLIMAAFFGGIAALTVPESSHNKLLQSRATKLRHETRNWAIHAKADETRVDFKALATTYLFKPFTMLFKEPILMLLTIYMALIYGILYLFFEAYPISFQEQRGWNAGVGALPFISIIIGVFVGAITVSITTRTRFARKIKEAGRVIPEERLPPMIIGSVILPIGLFWFAWTSNPNITWVPQVISGGFIGCGIFMIFLQGLSYIVDVYLWNANSAIAANTFLRSLAGAGFPLFATGMYDNLGVDWATSLLGFLCIAMIPAPVVFYYYGARIRKMSKYSPDLGPH